MQDHYNLIYRGEEALDATAVLAGRRRRDSVEPLARAGA